NLIGGSGAFVQDFFHYRGNLGPRDATTQKRVDRHLVGRREDRRGGAADPSRLIGEGQARERREIGYLEVEPPEVRPVDRAVRLGQPVRRAQRERDRQAHV